MTELSLLAGGSDSDSIVVVSQIIRAIARVGVTARLIVLTRRIRAIGTIAGSVACWAMSVVGIVRLLPFHWHCLLFCWVLQALGPRVLCPAIQITVQHAWGAAVALRSASRLLRVKLIVAMAFVIRVSFVAGSL